MGESRWRRASVLSTLTFLPAANAASYLEAQPVASMPVKHLTNSLPCAERAFVRTWKTACRRSGGLGKDIEHAP